MTFTPYKINPSENIHKFQNMFSYYPSQKNTCLETDSPEKYGKQKIENDEYETNKAFHQMI